MNVTSRLLSYKGLTYLQSFTHNLTFMIHNAHHNLEKSVGILNSDAMAHATVTALLPIIAKSNIKHLSNVKAHK